VKKTFSATKINKKHFSAKSLRKTIFQVANLNLSEKYRWEENFRRLQEPNHKIVIAFTRSKRRPLHLCRDYTVKTLLLIIGLSAALKFTSYYTNFRLFWVSIMEAITLVPRTQF